MKKIFFLFLVFLFHCGQEEKVTQEKISEKKSYKDIVLKDWNGVERKIGDFKGKILVLDVWASWCVPCKESVPVIEDLIHKFQSEKDIIFFGLNSDTEISIEEIKAAAQGFGMTYPSLLDREFQLIDELGVQGQPALFIFDRESKKKYIQYGIIQSDLEPLTEKIKFILKG